MFAMQLKWFLSCVLIRPIHFFSESYLPNFQKSSQSADSPLCNFQPDEIVWERGFLVFTTKCCMFTTMCCLVTSRCFKCRILHFQPDENSLGTKTVWRVSCCLQPGVAWPRFKQEVVCRQKLPQSKTSTFYLTANLVQVWPGFARKNTNPVHLYLQ